MMTVLYEPELEEDQDSMAEIRQAIVQALSGPANTYRTPGGISRETGLSEETVRNYLESHPQEFHTSSIRPGGRTIYCRVTREKDE
jgi:hypothetical protein